MQRLTDLFKVRWFKLVFSITFSLYFLFYQVVDRIILFQNIVLPKGVYLVVDTSTPVPPSQMPYPLWGPFISITSYYLDWAITPLSLGVSFILSFLVALNVSLYLALFRLMQMSSTHRLAASLGLLATSLSCSCELFTALIGATVSNIPFMISIGFMDTLGITLTLVAGIILTLSSLVIASEITGSRPFSWMRGNYAIAVAIILLTSYLLIPQSQTFFLVRITDMTMAGGVIAYAASKRLRLRGNPLLFWVSAGLITAEIVGFPLMVPVVSALLSLIAGAVGYLGYSTLKPWARLGLLHVVGWTLIMPGPISLILGQPIPFFNLVGDQAILFWITAWIFGTPISWLAGIQYLQYIRDSMVNYSPTKMDLRLPPRRAQFPWQWFLLGGVAVVSQILFFMTHPQDFLDYNGYDMVFLEATTLASTLLITAGLILIGYGVYELIRDRYGIPRISNKHFLIAVLIYGVLEMIATKMLVIAPSGYPYPPILLLTYGEPMYAPAVTIYIPNIIGFYIYPVSLLALISSSLLAGYIWALVFQTRRNRLGSLTAFSLITACPSCGLSAMGYVMSSLVTAASFLASTYAQIGMTLVSLSLLVGLLVYVLRTSKGTCDLKK